MSPEPKPQAATSPSWSPSFVQWFVHLLLLFLLAGTAVPEINESHYLPKAKHAYDASFAPGDLFLESHDSHFLATQSAGWLTTILPLPLVAWIGRAVAWAFLAFAWLRLTGALGIARWASPFALATWYFAVHYGNWAGEWAIGGFEGKSIAYPAVLLSLAQAVENRWTRVWPWIAFAICWHPLVGGWAGLTLVLVWTWRCARTEWRSQIVSQIASLLVAMAGVLPAFMGTSGSGSEGKLIASQIHVYFRLSHHLCPLSFAWERHVAATIMLGLFVIMFGLWFVLSIRRKRAANSTQANAKPFTALSVVQSVAWLSLLFAAIGLAIDIVWSDPQRATFQPELASKLLRFYWFRWSDVAVPLAASLTAWGLLSNFCVPETSARDGKAAQGTHSLTGSVVPGITAVAMISVLALVTIRLWETWEAVPAADRLLVNTPGERRELTWQDSDSNRYLDWLAVCAWIRENTPTDSLWLTPKYQQSFKWYAQRAEVVCWKDVPQDNRSVIEWYKRIRILEPRRDSLGRVRGWNTDELDELSQYYGFQYVLVDRTYYATGEVPPRHELLYPVDIDNRSFAVCRLRPEIRDAFLAARKSNAK